jgi:peptide/nickel transport system permease protein
MGSVGSADLGQRIVGRREAIVHDLLGNKVTTTGLSLIVVLLAIAATAPWLAPYDPLDQDIFNADAGPTAEHWFGTDQFGRDVLARVIYGTRVSLLLGIAAPVLAGIAGTLVGTAAGYFGGWADRLTTRVSDLFMSFPTLLLGVMIAAALGPGFRNVIIAISVALFPRFVRLARASTLSVRTEVYIEASVAAGQSPFKIIWLHILPNISGPIVVMSTLWIATAIRLEASLSFLGLGTQPPSPSWGNMVRDGMNNLLGSPWPIVFAGLAITISVLAFNMVGDALRDALDPETAPR